MQRLLLVSLIIFILGLWGPLRPGLVQAAQADGRAPLPGEAIILPVAPLQQLKPTSCGEAVLAMAYQYAYLQAGIDEQDLIIYAEMQGYYTEKKFPFTSPANMVKITEHYTRNFSSGTVSTPAQGLELLIGELKKGHPVIIDVTARLDDPLSGAHFVLVTGLSVASDNKNAIMVYYNEPITGKNKSSPWYGAEGFWKAWLKNGDRGGSGWWLSIHSPPPAWENTLY